MPHAKTREKKSKRTTDYAGEGGKAIKESESSEEDRESQSKKDPGSEESTQHPKKRLLVSRLHGTSIPIRAA